MTGCLLSLVVWVAATAMLFWFGSGAPAETVATVIGVAVGAGFCVQSAVWLTTRASSSPRRAVRQALRSPS